jgi:hypothetical protein
MKLSNYAQRVRALTMPGLAVAAVLLSAGTAPAQEGQVEALQQGGYILLLRHAEAVPGARPDALAALPAQFADCDDPGRMLTAKGVADSHTMGNALNTLAIPVGAVMVSPACRAVETAWYAFDRATIAPDLLGLKGNGPPAAQNPQVMALNEMLAASPAPDTNSVLLTHSSNALEATGVTLEEGDAVVVRPDGIGSYELLGVIKPEDWVALAAGAGQ